MGSPAQRQGSESRAAAPRGLLHRLGVRFRPLPVLLTLITIAVMLGLGVHIVEKFRVTQLQAYNRIAEVYVEQVLGPYALVMVRGDTASAPRSDGPSLVLERYDDRSPAIALQIWGLDGALLFSTSPDAKADTHDDDDLLLAIAGNSVSRIETPGRADDGAPFRTPYLEIYVPIADPETGSPMAVGELYVDATRILGDLRTFARTVYSGIGLATLAVLGMLAAIARQSEQLRDLLTEEQRLSAQNEALHLAAEQAHLDASKANEQALNLIGAEIHDGPVQLLGLASLMAPKDEAVTLGDGTTRSELVNQAVAQLRRVSAGLILPELEGLNLQEVAELAVTRHRALVGTTVELDCKSEGIWLDMPRRICLYRVIQEGLMNAARHGEGQTAKLQLRATSGTLTVSILSRQTARPTEVSQDPSRQLGLQGMRLRLQAFHGTVVLRTMGEATVLTVTLPVPAADPGPVSG